MMCTKTKNKKREQTSHASKSILISKAVSYGFDRYLDPGADLPEFLGPKVFDMIPHMCNSS